MSETSADKMDFKLCTNSGSTDALEFVAQGWCLKRLWYHCGEATGHRAWSDGVKED